MIYYRSDLTGISAEAFTGFFVGWPTPPTPETHLRLLAGSSHLELALEEEQVVGFISAISDGVLSAHIPLLEVLPTHQGKGIGSELVRRLLGRLESFYMVDVICDEDLAPFYRRFGLTPARGMMLRNYARQSGH